MTLLFGLGVAVLLSVVFRRSYGDIACAWRVSYSPCSTAFAIWPLIFVWMMASVAYQLMTAWDLEWAHAAQPWNNMLDALAFVLCGAWVMVFSYSRRADARTGLVVSAAFLLAVAWCAVGAAAQEATWRTLEPWPILGVGVPFALFASWSCVAAALGLGVAYNAIFNEPDYRCFEDDESYNVMVEADLSDQDSSGSWVPLVLTVVVGTGAVLVPDPVLPLPLVWGVLHMKRHLKNLLAICFAVACSILALAFALLGVWAF